ELLPVADRPNAVAVDAHRELEARDGLAPSPSIIDPHVDRMRGLRLVIEAPDLVARVGVVAFRRGGAFDVDLAAVRRLHQPDRLQCVVDLLAEVAEALVGRDVGGNVAASVDGHQPTSSIIVNHTSTAVASSLRF